MKVCLNPDSMKLSDYVIYPIIAIMKKNFSLHARLQSFVYAFQGLRLLVQSQHNAWIHLMATIVVVVLGFYWQLSRFEWSAMIFAVILVWVAEAFNTALEFLADHISPEFAPLIGKAKDLAAAAVLIASIGAVIIGLLILGPAFLDCF